MVKVTFGQNDETSVVLTFDLLFLHLGVQNLDTNPRFLVWMTDDLQDQDNRTQNRLVRALKTSIKTWIKFSCMDTPLDFWKNEAVRPVRRLPQNRGVRASFSRKLQNDQERGSEAIASLMRHPEFDSTTK